MHSYTTYPLIGCQLIDHLLIRAGIFRTHTSFCFVFLLFLRERDAFLVYLCVSLCQSHTNAVDGLETPNETPRLLAALELLSNKIPVCSSDGERGGDSEEAEKERADGESERRNQVSYPGDDQTDRRAGSRGRRAVPEHVDFRKETLGSEQAIRNY